MTATVMGTGAVWGTGTPEGTLRTPPTPTVLTRGSFGFSANGMQAVCCAGDDQGGFHLEAWSFAGPSPRWWSLQAARAVTPETQLVPLDDGRILLCRASNIARAHEIVLLDPRGGTRGDALDGPVHERVLGVVPSDGLVGLRLLPGPGSDLGLAIALDDRGCSTIWRVALHAPQFTRLAEVPGALLDGVWLDDAARLLGIGRAEDGGPVEAVAVDLRDGSWTSLLHVSTASNDRLLLASPRSGLVVVSTDASGEERLGCGRLGAREPVRFPETLHRPGQGVGPLTLDPDGQRVLLQLDEGVRSRLAVYTPATDRLAPVEIPEGYIRGPAHWAGEVLRFPFSTPSCPPGVATVGIGEATGWSLAGSRPNGVHWADAHVERLEGAAGPVEAIVYGGESWRTSERLVLVLHGGPVDAWRFEFQPLFQLLAAAGIALVAPNQRGSSGYGVRHTLALRGAWGGPDLDDVCSIAHALVTQRRALGVGDLMLLGMSYGAYLALLAASCDPDSWSRCVALAPFLSGPRLYREASSGTQGLIERLGGCQELHDRIGPRDVLRLCHAIRAKLLVVHGDHDEVTPVSQSRALTSRLLELGRREGVDFDYVEVPGGRHDLVTGAGSHAVHERLLRFLLAGGRGHDAPQGPEPRDPERR